MTEQHRTTDIENLWLEWNKANQDLWNRMLQSWTNPTRQGDIFSLWPEWNKANQDLWNRMTMHDAFGKALQEYMVQALQTMKIASADDITRLAEMIINLENKVDQLADEVEKASKTAD